MTPRNKPKIDRRSGQILELLVQYALGNLEARATPSERGDVLDAILTGVCMLGEELSHSFEALRARTAELEQANAQLRKELEEHQRTQAALRRSEEQVRQSQKMRAIGQLAGGVAHDFNNLLQGIQGTTELALDALEPEHPARADLQEVLAATERAATLTRQLLSFSRRDPLRPQSVDLDEVVPAMLGVLRRVIEEPISIVVQTERPRSVYADTGQIEQMLTNLCLNARDAMPEGGTITIKLGNASLDRAYCESHSWAREGEYVVLSVSDTGVGMPPDVLEHLFDPFSVSGSQNDVAGIGLATVVAIAQRHNGLLEARSQPGGGTTLSIYLPCEEVSDKQPVPSEHEPRVQGSATILLAEDDELVRKVATRILQRAGYGVLVASDGQEACELFLAHAPEINLALLDVIMPKKNGRQVYETIALTKPELPVLFASGYGFHALDMTRMPKGRVDLIQKPYHPGDLLERLREMLEDRG